jgi:predicted short-subunit dehydrogenase-like oxidoreductase (DUF2520 family)
MRVDRSDAPTRRGISIIGAGNWGSSLAAAVVHARIPLLEIVVRHAQDRRRKFGESSVVLLEDAALDASVIWLCVPDQEITAVTLRLSQLRGNLRGQTVVHSSGAMTAKTLDPAKGAGASVGGIAPVCSFPTRDTVPLGGVNFIVEAGPERTWRKLSMLVGKLGGTPLRIDSAKKALYHSAATMASPLMVSAVHAAVQTARLSGLTTAEAEAVVRALALGSLRNYFENGSEKSFSGAFARGDAGTVELHLQALLAHPNLHAVYLELARQAVGSLEVRNRADLERVLAMDRSIG